MKKRGPRIQIRAGTSIDNLCRVNLNADETGPLKIKTDSFEGSLIVRVKNFADEDGEIYRDTESRYFLYHPEVSWSIQVQGRFLKPTSADEVVFGNIFERPIRDRLPYGTALALKALSYIDPSLEHDLYADKPWAWSPALVTMNYACTQKLESDDSPLPSWNSQRPKEDCKSVMVDTTNLPSRRIDLTKPHSRRKFFASEKNRKDTVLGPRDFLNLDFANGYLDFSTLCLVIPVVNVTFNLDKLWDGQPVRYMCLSRYSNEIYFLVEFQIADLEAENKLEKDDSDTDKELTPEESAAQSRRATRGNSAALRPDDLPPVDDWGVD